MRPMRSSISPTVGKEKLQDFCPTLELPIADSAAKDGADGTVLGAIHSKWGCNEKRTDLFQGLW